MPETKMLHVRVDPDRCQGHNRCKAVAPELFEVDGLGNGRAAGDGSVAPGLEGKAWRARDNCPEGAVEISERSEQSLATRYREAGQTPRREET
jgi:ferredoxin